VRGRQVRENKSRQGRHLFRLPPKLLILRPAAVSH
jgi:hypothetical protein